jgi:hypothetical protein
MQLQEWGAHLVHHFSSNFILITTNQLRQGEGLAVAHGNPSQLRGDVYGSNPIFLDLNNDMIQQSSINMKITVH